MPELKICKRVKKYDFDLEEYYTDIASEPVSNFKVNNLNNDINIFWRQKMWDVAIYRSMEVWKKMPIHKIEDSLGKLTNLAKKSLAGKLGNANKRFFAKDESKNWIFIKWKEQNNEKAFLQFNENAVIACKIRAKKYFR